ncbi:MAG: NTP transferase domain-containing protein [Candidatus Cloacimonetes bacterium]|nr:NTP transferase domain-containing protein [Candidatus Cloacimonadota bacterium]
MKAVIIAAGCGSRLKNEHQGIPKTLMKINGKRIIDDIIDKVHACGISELIIVTGFEDKLLEEGLRNYENSMINIQFVHNPDWEKANGISVFAAHQIIEVKDQFILLMSDHIFSRKMLQMMIDTDVPADEALLAIDFKITSIPDLDDGMKVVCKKDKNKVYQITEFGKQLNEFNAIDAGMFKLNYSFFDALADSIENDRTSLSDACNVFSAKGKMKGLDIGDSLWLDVDTPEMIGQTNILAKIFDRDLDSLKF